MPRPAHASQLASRLQLDWRLLGYPLAVTSVSLAAILTFLLWHPLFSRNPLALFYAAVVLTAWFGGLCPGLLAAGLAVILVDYLFIPTFATSPWDHFAQTASFAFTSVLVSWLDGRRRRALQEAKHAKELAESASTAKDRFLAVLSHELRTPLTPALAASAVLRADPDLPPQLRKDLQLIHRNIELEARLIDDLLDLTRITRGKLQLAVQDVDLHELIRQVIDSCRGEMQSKRQELSIELAALASQVIGDAARLQQVLWNLVKNAIKFTPDGGHITVRTTNGAAPAGAAGATLRVQVCDTGIGIAADMLPRVFQAFEQGDQSINRRFGGLGLGLSIARQLIMLHGGSLDAQSPGVDLGSTFTVTLHDAVTARKTATTPKPAAENPPRPLRLLLVEDHADTAKIMVRLLRTAKHDVQSVGSVREALAAAAESKFDLVISDIGLPDGTGVELFTQLKRMYGVRGIALSGYGMEEDVQRCAAAGFEAHLTKPIDPRRLHELIQQFAPAQAQTV